MTDKWDARIKDRKRDFQDFEVFTNYDTVRIITAQNRDIAVRIYASEMIVKQEVDGVFVRDGDHLCRFEVTHG